MSSLQPVRGTRDLLPEECRKHQHVVDSARTVSARWGYGEIATPIFETTQVFARTLGDTSDIVTKEMYTFEDKGGHSLTLRPEGTAAVARAFISGKLGDQLPLKFFYHGPMFRFERPQKGRQRQFHQIGVELFGVAAPEADVEVVALGAQILEALGVLDRTRLEINTLGDAASRAAYRVGLVAYFEKHRDALSEESRERLARNPLRILDSKEERDRRIVAEAPRFTDHLNDESRRFFDTVLEGLDDLGIAYERNERLVRGLDYYCHTAFEFTTTDLGAQGAVLAGGRYDGLVETMGGPATPGVGWAAGIERLVMLGRDWPPPPRPVVLVPLGPEAERRSRRLAWELRRAGFTVELGYSGNLRRRLARADKLGARVAVILGDDELARGEATLRDMDGGAQESVPLARLAERLSQG